MRQTPLSGFVLNDDTMTAQQALDDGWKVAALDLNAEGLDLLGENSDLLKIVLDVTDRQAVATAVEQCEVTLGPITRVIHAAGIMPLGELVNQSRDLISTICIRRSQETTGEQSALPNTFVSELPGVGSSEVFAEPDAVYTRRGGRLEITERAGKREVTVLLVGQIIDVTLYVEATVRVLPHYLCIHDGIGILHLSIRRLPEVLITVEVVSTRCQ